MYLTLTDSGFSGCHLIYLLPMFLFKLFGILSFDYTRTWRRIFQQYVMRNEEFNIYV